jgi:integrase/recombinase XerD
MGDGVAAGARVVGPLAPYAPGFARQLTEAGCCAWSVRQQLDFMAELSGWLAWYHLDAGELTPTVVRRVLASRRASGKLLVSRRGAAPVLGYLDGLGVLPANPAPDTPQEALLAEYRGYLSRERGLAEGTIRNHLDVAAAVFARIGDPFGECLLGLSAGQALAIASVQFRGVSASTAQGRASSLRVLLRFLLVTGRITADLAAVIPAVASRRSSLPRRLPAGTAAMVAGGCDRGSEPGLRARAIMLLLARLGLRESEIAALTLEDIDWRAGEITIRGKGGRIDTLPLVRVRRSPPTCAGGRPARPGRCSSPCTRHAGR